MSTILVEGSSFQGFKIEKLLGAGGQGEVYLVKDEAKGQQYALKWYFKNQATAEQEENIQNLVNKYQPGREFLWPLRMVKSSTVPGFGYLMALRPNDYSSLNDLMRRKAEPSFRSLIMAAYRLVQGFHWLHNKGLCYRDISFGNAFFKVSTGEILICDNDNVGPAGSGKTTTVNGTPKFMAPEIVRGEAGPSANTDLFSLSVLLFYFFYLGHPLDGKKEAAIRCFDLKAMQRLYGESPIYIFDPQNDTNRPVPGLHDNPIAYKSVYPDEFQLLFEKAFVDGLTPQKRVSLGEWRLGLLQLLASLNSCSHCGAENFGNKGKCWSCQRPLNERPIVRTSGKISLLLHKDSICYTDYFSTHANNEPFKDKVFEVNQHPADPSKWGLKNLTKDTWTVTAADGGLLTVEPQRSLALRSGTKVQVGNTSHWFEIA